tara:strand:+ start:256 stop:498 length:243 start_codon:yes stop_codon:yes gene_type:complete
MEIRQDKDGNGIIEFNEAERKILSKKGRIDLPAPAMKEFANILMKLCADITENIPKEFKHMQTDPGKSKFQFHEVKEKNE